MRANSGISLALAGVLMLAGCSFIPKYERTLPKLPTNWTSGAGASGQAGAVLPKWRQVVTDTHMRSLIEMALANNRDLRAAAYKVERAQAQYRIQRADLLPSIGVGAQSEMQRLPRTLSSAGRAYTSRSYEVGLASNAFELDLFGRIRSLKKEALEQFLATEEARRGVELSLVSQVATTYLTLAADREHLVLTRQILETQKDSYEIVRQRAANGVANDLDLKRAQSTVDTARVSVAKYAEAVTEDENELSVLVGQPLKADQMPAKSLAEIAPLMPVPAGLPSEVLTRRPDVLAAEHQLKAANADIGAARARYFPTITLTGSYGTASNQVHDLFRDGFTTWSFTPQIAAPIFNSGAIRAGVKAAEAERKVMVAQYEKAVQTAFREVSNCLALGTALNREVDAQSSLAKAAATTYRLSTLRYEAGVDGYLSKLDAERSDVSARQDLISLRLAQESNVMTLFKTLGGGWSARSDAFDPDADRSKPDPGAKTAAKGKG